MGYSSSTNAHALSAMKSRQISQTKISEPSVPEKADSESAEQILSSAAPYLLTISLAKKVTNRLHFYFHKLIPA